VVAMVSLIEQKIALMVEVFVLLFLKKYWF